MLHCHNPPRVHQLATGLPCSSSPCRRHSLQYDSMGPRSVCPASSCRPSLLDGGHGHSLLSTHPSSVRESNFTRRPRPTPLAPVVQFDGKTFPPPPSVPLSPLYLPLLPPRPRPRPRPPPPLPPQCIMHEHASIADHNATKAARGRRRKLTRPDGGRRRQSDRRESIIVGRTKRRKAAVARAIYGIYRSTKQSAPRRAAPRRAVLGPFPKRG